MDLDDSNDEEDSIPTKRARTKLEQCTICAKKSPIAELTSPKDVNSWTTLLRAAEIQGFIPITNLCEHIEDGEIPSVYYHRQCRSTFTLKKTLDAIVSKDAGLSSESSIVAKRKSLRDPSQSTSRVYDAVCIFCGKCSKYVKGTNTRETLTQSVDLRSDEQIKKAALQKMDARIMPLVIDDTVAKEVHYHKSCYRAYTRGVKHSIDPVSVDTDPYGEAEIKAYDMLFTYVRCDLFSNPRVIRMTDLTHKLTQYMQTLGFEDIKDHTKKHIRRKLESEFGDSLCIISDTGKLLVIPDNLTREDLAKENAALNKKLEMQKDDEMEKILLRAALYLRDEVKGTVREQQWPPLPEELDQDYLPLPDALLTFYQVLISGQSKSLSGRTQRLARSFAQDCVYGISGGRQKSNKHILTAWAIKTLTGNGELIKGLNRLGHAISYSQLAELDTALAMQKLAVEDELGIAIPSNIQPGVPTTVAFDNIDRLEETLSGGGTSHRVNGIAVQPTVHTVQPYREAGIAPKERRRSITPTNVMLPPYNAGARTEPPVIKTLEFDTGNAAEEARLKNLVWSLARQRDTDNQKISSWTGHNIRTRNQITVTQDNIGYLPTINAPATQMSTMFEILNQVLRIMGLLQIPNIACVFDQAMYEKAMDVKWRHAEQFQHIVVRMGAFHTCCNLMGTIGKRFVDAGLRDLAVESGIVAEGSVENVMSGKKYNRAVRFHKLVYEAFLRLAWKGFYPWFEEHHVEHLPQLQDTIRLVGELHLDVSQETLNNVLQDPSCQCVMQLFDRYLDHLRESNGPLSQFWMSYLDMVDILLGMIRASREGNWLLHMDAIRKMIPWSFAYDKRNYAKYLTVYYGEMSTLSTDQPEIHNTFMNAGFSVQLGDKNPFGRIPVDQTVEETVNKDTQTAGGTRGFSLRAGAVSKYYLTAEHRSASLRQFRTMVQMVDPEFVHPDLEPSRIRKDEAGVQSLVDMMEDNWTNPLEEGVSDLISISTGTAATPDIAHDLLQANVIGEKAYSDFKQKRVGPNKSEKFHGTLSKQNLKTFSNLKEQRKTTSKSQRETVLKADHRLFGRIILIASSRNLQMKDVLKHPLGPLPWALANCDGTLKKTNKASLAKHLEQKTAVADVIPQPSVCLIDGMSLVQKAHGEHKTFGEVSEHILMSALNAGSRSTRVDVIFDVYKATSIKNAERVKRGSGVLFTNISHGHKIHQWRKLLACSDSKTSLIKFLTTDWQKPSLRERLGDTELYVTCEEKCIRITKNGCDEVMCLQSTQEEADTRLLLHAHQAAPNFESAIIVADDTDVLILGLAFSKDIDCNVYMKSGTQTRTRFIDVTKLAHVLGESVCNALIGLHAFTGCDSVSAFAGKGKVSGLKMLANPTFQNTFAQIGKEWLLTDDLAEELQEFTCRLYNARSPIKTVNDLRYQLFRAKKGEVESGQLPPCEDCLSLHARRANYQAGIWCRSLQAIPETPTPCGHGWTEDLEGNLSIRWMNGEPAPDVVLEFLSCKCPRVCKLPTCLCMSNGMMCTDTCKLSICDNMPEEENDTFDSSDDEEETED
jgi:hypothetical protein